MSYKQESERNYFTRIKRLNIRIPRSCLVFILYNAETAATVNYFTEVFVLLKETNSVTLHIIFFITLYIIYFKVFYFIFLVIHQ